MPENDLEAIIKATRHFQNFNEIVYIADNYACIRDFNLIENIKYPIRIIACGTENGINEQLFDLAYKTKGSIHTADIDIDFSINPMLSKSEIIEKYNLNVIPIKCKKPLFIKHKLKVINKSSNSNIEISALDEYYNFRYKLIKKKKKKNVFYLPTNAKRNIILKIKNGKKTTQIYLEDLRYNKLTRTYKLFIQ